MSRGFQLLLFLLAFQMDVRVRANLADKPFAKPEGCWLSGVGECVVQTGKQPLFIQSKSFELWAGGDSVLERGPASWKVLKGSVRTKSEHPVVIQFPFGEVSAEQGEFWIIDRDSRFVVRSIHSESKVKTLEGKVIQVPEGLEIWIGNLNVVGRAVHGVPSLVPLEDHLKRWRDLARPSKSEMSAMAKSLKQRWSRRAELAATLYQKTADRELASIAEGERRKKAAEERERAEKERFRRLLFEKAFER